MTRIRTGLLLALNFLIITTYLILSWRNGVPLGDQLNALAFSLFPVVGAVLLARHPRNPVGYLVTVLGMAVLGAGLLYEYANLPLRQPGSAYPLAGEAAWLAMNLWTLAMPCLVLILLLFPDGRFTGWGWRALAVGTVLVTGPVMLAALVITYRNRAMITWMESGRVPFNAEMIALYRAYDFWNLLMVAAVILALVSFFGRFARARGIERQQLKWFVFGLSTIPVSMVLDELMTYVDIPLLAGFNLALNIFSIAAFPLVLLIAMTRYRLYDIDFIIRKTLLYSALTLTLGLIYFAVVLSMQALFTRSFGEQPEILIVLTTLLIAALFQPLRRRFQTAINRRFYRSKYNAEQTAQAFSTRLQSEVDLDAIERQFMAVVEENIQPEQVALWLVRK